MRGTLLTLSENAHRLISGHSLERMEAAFKSPSYAAERELRMYRRRGMMNGNPVCFFIDDFRQLDWSFLWGLSPGQVDRVEIFDRGGWYVPARSDT